MTTRVQIAHADQTPASTAAVKRLHDLGRGVVVVYPTPGRGGDGIARDILQALGKQFRDRTPRDPRKLEALAVLWLRAERAAGLLIGAAERRPADDWRLLGSLCGETPTRLTMIVEQPASDRHVAALGGDVRELTLAELVAETPVMPEDPWRIFDESGSPDDRRGYPPVPDVDFALFPSACRDVLLRYDAGWAVRTFDQARRATMLWLELRRGIEERHGPSPSRAHAFLDTLVAPCVTVDAAITFLRGAQAGFLLDGILLEIDADAFAVDHARRGAPATSATARTLRSYPEPRLAAAGALACATRANPAQIAGLSLAAVTPVDASLASGHRIAPPFQSLLDAQRLARDADGADGDEPVFLAPDGSQPAVARHIQQWLARIGRETGLRFESTSGWNRYTTPAWATFHELAIPALIAR